MITKDNRVEAVTALRAAAKKILTAKRCTAIAWREHHVIGLHDNTILTSTTPAYRYLIGCFAHDSVYLTGIYTPTDMNNETSCWYALLLAEELATAEIMG